MIRTGMSRGIVVLDEDVLSLKALLQDRNLRVLVPPAKTSDPKIIAEWLPGRMLITNNQSDFKERAEAFEFGVIQVSQSLLSNPEKLATWISQEISKRRLWRSKPFILSLSPEMVRYTKL